MSVQEVEDCRIAMAMRNIKKCMEDAGKFDDGRGSDDENEGQ